MKTVYKFKFDCRRSGEVVGLFLADSEDVRKLIDSGETVYFGEVLCKHSEVYGPIDKTDVTFVTDKPEVIEMIEKFDLCFGYNPFDYLKEKELDNE